MLGKSSSGEVVGKLTSEWEVGVLFWEVGF